MLRGEQTPFFRESPAGSEHRPPFYLWLREALYMRCSCCPETEVGSPRSVRERLMSPRDKAVRLAGKTEIPRETCRDKSEQLVREVPTRFRTVLALSNLRDAMLSLELMDDHVRSFQICDRLSKVSNTASDAGLSNSVCKRSLKDDDRQQMTRSICTSIEAFDGLRSPTGI